MYHKQKQKGISLISLVITIIVLIILASTGIYLTLAQKGIATKAKEEYIRQTATEKINLKITTAQMNTYAEKQELPTLQELADFLCEDEEIQYVELESQKQIASLNKIIIGDKNIIYTKLKDYDYEFGINSSLQLASIDGEQIITTPSAPENEAPNSQNTMSGTEHFIGEYYFNGKPIYAKTIYIESLPNNTTKNYNHNISHIEEIWIDQSNSYIKWGNANQTAGPLPFLNVSSLTSSLQINVNNTSVNIKTLANWSSNLAYITLKYVKTTDTGNGNTITATPAN